MALAYRPPARWLGNAPTRTDWSGWAGFGGVAIAAVVLILTLAREATFYNDEWWYIQGRSLGDPAGWFRAHVEHWVTFHVITYRLIYETFGQGSYLPFMAALMAAHVSAAGALFLLVRRVSGGWAPLAAASLFLLLGSGYFNLFWAFQIGMVGALSLGLWALVALPSRPWVAAILLLLSTATVGNGLIMVAAALTYVLLTTRWHAPLMAIPFLAYGAWWIVIGSDSATVLGAPLTSDIGLVARFPLVGLGSWVGGLTGVGPYVGLGLVVAAPIILYGNRAQIGPLVIAALAALGAQAAALAVTRSLVNLPSEPHYIYIAAPFVLIIVATLQLPLKRALFAWALSVNVAMLVYWGPVWTTTRLPGILAGAP